MTPSADHDGGREQRLVMQTPSDERFLACLESGLDCADVPDAVRSHVLQVCSLNVRVEDGLEHG